MRIKRPAILFLAAVILGIIIEYSLVPALFKLILLAIAIFLYGKLFIDGKLYFRTLIVILLFSLLGFCRFKYIENVFDRYEINVVFLGKGNKIITGKVEQIGKSTNSNYYVLSNCNSNGLELGKCRCYFDDELISNVKIGNLIKIDAGTAIIDRPLNEGEFNQRNYYRSDGITFISFAKSVEVINAKQDTLKQNIYEVKQIIKSQIEKIFNAKDAGLFSAMITGDKSTIDRIQKKRFADNGIAHILAISGLHLSILGLALFEILRKKLSVNKSALLVSVFIVLYGIFIDAGPSSMRAITMLFVRFLSLAIGRAYDSRNTLYIIAFIFIMINPYLLFNAGFQFSYVAIFALNYEVKYTRLKRRDRKFVRLMGYNPFEKEEKKVPAVIILTLFLFPITVFHYFTYPLYSIFLNLIVIPLMSLVLGFGLIGLLASFVYIPIGKIIVFIVHIIFLVYDKLCEFVEMLPSHLLVLGKPTLYETLYYFVALFLICYVINERNKNAQNVLLQKDGEEIKEENEWYRNIIINIESINKVVLVSICSVLLIMSVLIIAIRRHSDMRFTFVSIGQGDSVLVEMNDLILTIDGGSSSNKSNGQYVLSPHIKSRAIDHIDYSYITHADDDHTNGIIYLLENDDEIKIKNLVLPITAVNDNKFDKLRNAATLSGTNVSYMKEGDVEIFKNNMKLTVLSPNEESSKSKKINQNEMSLTFRIDYNNHSALFTGDIGKETIGRMIKDAYCVENMDVDILKVPHHGSKNSNVPKFFDLVSPKYSVFSYGRNNNYGHPNQETVDSIENTGSKVLKTGESGQIDIYLDNDVITYNTFR